MTKTAIQRTLFLAMSSDGDGYFLVV
jgi:hypothetical protein